MNSVELNRQDDGCWHVVLAAPERRNSLDQEMVEQLGSAVATVAADSEARALVVGGRGPAFCAGADLLELFGSSERTVSERRDHLRRIYASFLAIRYLEIPTIAALQGPALGAGLNLAMACDVRIVGPAARLGAPFTRIGLHPGGGATAFLVEAVGRQRALAILLDGGDVDAERAVQAGLALELVDDAFAAACERATRWAGLPPTLVHDIRTAVGLAETCSFDGVVEFEAWAQASSSTQRAFQEELERWRQRRLKKSRQ